MHYRTTLTAWFTIALLAACNGQVSGPGGSDGPGPNGDPGRVTVHRLNNAEYNNTVRDLLGTSLRPADAFPADDYAHGFDNISDVLGISPLQTEQYLRAAEVLAQEALRSPTGESRLVEAETLAGTSGAANGSMWVLSSAGEVSTTVTLAQAGTYQFRVRAYAQQGGPDLAKMELRVDGTVIASPDVPAVSAAPAVYEASVELGAGQHIVAAAFVNDFYDAATGADRNLYVDWIELSGPEGLGANPMREKLLVCVPDENNPQPCIAQIATSFARRAWRRPATDAEIATLVSLIDVADAQGEGIDRGLELLIEAVLASPSFLFRFEIDPNPHSKESRPLNSFELASRLSYFLWSSMPDDELLELADGDSLLDFEVLSAQIDRMLDDEKAQAFIDNFAGQWINLRGLRDHDPDYALFPAFDDELRNDMIEETNIFFREILDQDRPITELLTADYSFINERLAAHYGIEYPGGEGFQRVTLPEERRGLFGQTSVLTVTSYPTRTSPVRRGKWVLEQLLCSAPPPPPPGVEGLDNQVNLEGSLRERMEEHRANPVCASCHQAMDPIGFSLENFDGVGLWRDMDGEYPIDAAGELPDGQLLSGASDLASVIASDPRFGRCMTEKMLTYALGRGLEEHDERRLTRLSDTLASEGMGLRQLIHLVATSDAFLFRRGEPAGVSQ